MKTEGKTRIGINGFGRIGRSVYRIAFERDDLEVVAINDLYENEQLAYLLEWDTMMRRFPHAISVDAESMTVAGRRVVMTAEREPANIPWRDLGVEIVVEASGVFTKREKLEKHLAAGAERVLLTVPAKDPIDATIVLGVNERSLKASDRIVSNASCTTNCLAPIAKILDDHFGIEEGFVTTVHAYTNDQRLADVPHRDFRRSRAAATNIIPTTTGAARAVGEVLPQLKGRLDGLAMRVPVPDGSTIDFACRLRAKPDAAAINATVKAAAEGALRGIVEWSEAPLVSSDIIGNPHSSIFDARSTEARGDGYAKIVAWYDNEWGYSNRVIDLIDLLADLS
jgi:glyceraldehyde 3-phosphate dehydrogenase